MNGRAFKGRFGNVVAETFGLREDPVRICGLRRRRYRRRRGLGVILVIEGQGVAIAAEERRYPRKGVRESPGCDAHAARRVAAGGDDRAVIVCLRREFELGRRQTDAHIEFGHGDVDA